MNISEKARHLPISVSTVLQKKSHATITFMCILMNVRHGVSTPRGACRFGSGMISSETQQQGVRNMRQMNQLWIAVYVALFSMTSAGAQDQLTPSRNLDPEFVRESDRPLAGKDSS